MKLKLDIHATHFPPSTWDNLHQRSDIDSKTSCASKISGKVEPSIWVKLLTPPTAFSFDEAWLLCQISENQWLGWIPDYGELLLNLDEFVV